MGWLEALVNRPEAHLWYVVPEQVTDDRLLAAYRDLLSPTERERNERFVVERERNERFVVERERNERFVVERMRHEHLVTRALVRTTLSAYCPDVDPRAWQFSAGPYGRPEIEAPACTPRLRFNLAHTEGLIVCLVAVEREIGVDVEDVTRAGTAGVKIAERYFAPSEVAELRAQPADAQRSRFFDFWTLKEAYIKARGLGLQLPLDQFSFHLGAAERAAARPIRISFGRQIADDPERWQFSLCDLTPRHRLAVAIRRRPDEPDLTVRCLPVVPLRTPARPPARS